MTMAWRTQKVILDVAAKSFDVGNAFASPLHDYLDERVYAA